MTKSSPNLIKKIFFTVAGFEHRDFASRYALTQGISSAFNDKILSAKNCVFGFEKSYDSAQKISVAMPGFNQLIKQKGFNAFQSSVFNPTIDDLAGSGPGTEATRMSIIDTLATHYMKNFCRDHGIKNSQLESAEIIGRIDADMNHLPLDQKEASLPRLDKLRVEAMMKNIQILTSFNQDGVMHATLMVGAAHVPVITAECLSLFNGSDKVAKVVPILLLSDQVASEMGVSSYGEALSFMRSAVEDFTVKRMQFDKNPKHTEIMQALQNTIPIRTTKNGIFADDTFKEITKSASRFLSTPSPSPSKSRQEKVAEDEVSNLR